MSEPQPPDLYQLPPTPEMPSEPAPTVDVNTPEHREQLAYALEQHAQEHAQVDPDRAQAALRAARAAQAGEELLYTVGTWGGMPNYQCRFCYYAHLSERAVATHSVACPYRPRGDVRPQRTVGGIT